ncbi:MAG: hypothetical protein JXB35_09665, partial [Anaerolineae bacterium]|nr:hypothetical protein [Anaerolineae bacterium]
MKPSRLGRAFLVGLPFILTASTALVFTSLPRRLNADLSYVLGFVFYDLVWCLAIPLSYLGPRRFAAIFKEETPLFSRANWLPALLLITTNIVALSMYAENIRNLGAISPALIAVGIPATLINSTCEEILWRGLYTQVFPGQWF